MEERRNPLRRHAQALIAAAAALCGAAEACELPEGARAESASYALAYRTVPARIALGEHFALEYTVCPKAGVAPPALVSADAWMPEHRHGMNYRPGITALGGGRFRAEGLLFHMPGRWEFVFQAGSERLAHSVRVN
jgi:hypothetical protein